MVIPTRSLLPIFLVLCLIHNSAACLRRTKVVYKDVCATGTDPFTTTADPATVPTQEVKNITSNITVASTVDVDKKTERTTVPTTKRTTVTTKNPKPTRTTPKPKPTTTTRTTTRAACQQFEREDAKVKKESDCPASEGWSFTQYGCFKIIGGDGRKHYGFYETKCIDAGGRVATPRSFEQAESLPALNHNDNIDRVAIGLRYSTSAFDTNEDGERLKFTYWNKYFQPFTTSGDKSCALAHVFDGGLWASNDCSSPNWEGAFCERRLKEEVCGHDAIDTRLKLEEEKKKPLECVYTYANPVQPCPWGWMEYRNAFRCYKPMDKSRTFADHQKECLEMNKEVVSQLASVHSDGQLEFIRKLFEGDATKEGFFIGLQTADLSGKFLDGSPVDYSYYANAIGIDGFGSGDVVYDGRFRDGHVRYWHRAELRDNVKKMAVCSYQPKGSWNHPEQCEHYVKQSKFHKNKPSSN